MITLSSEEPKRNAIKSGIESGTENDTYLTRNLSQSIKGGR